MLCIYWESHSWFLALHYYYFIWETATLTLQRLKCFFSPGVFWFLLSPFTSILLNKDVAKKLSQTNPEREFASHKMVGLNIYVWCMFVCMSVCTCVWRYLGQKVDHYKVAVLSLKDYLECKRVPRLSSAWLSFIELCCTFKVDNVDNAMDIFLTEVNPANTILNWICFRLISELLLTG